MAVPPQFERSDVIRSFLYVKKFGNLKVLFGLT